MLRWWYGGTHNVEVVVTYVIQQAAVATVVYEPAAAQTHMACPLRRGAVPLLASRHVANDEPPLEPSNAFSVGNPPLPCPKREVLLALDFVCGTVAVAATSNPVPNVHPMIPGLVYRSDTVLFDVSVAAIRLDDYSSRSLRHYRRYLCEACNDILL